MSKQNVVVLAALAVALVAIPSILAVALGWPVWLWSVVVLALLMVPVVVASRLYDRELHEQRMRELHAQRAAAREEPESEQEPEPEVHRCVLNRVALPSAQPEYQFLFSATVCWRPTYNGVGVPYTNPRAVAEELVVARARDIVATESPESVDPARHRVTAALGEWLRDRSGHLDSCAEDVVLTLSEEDARRLRRLAEVRKEEAVWEREREYERSRRAYYRDEVFQSTASALIWLLAQQAQDRENARESVSSAVDLLGKLARISSVVRDGGTTADTDGALEEVVFPATNGSRVLTTGANPAPGEPAD